MFVITKYQVKEVPDDEFNASAGLQGNPYAGMESSNNFQKAVGLCIDQISERLIRIYKENQSLINEQVALKKKLEQYATTP